MKTTLRPIQINSDDLILIKKLKKEYEEKKREMIQIILNEIKNEFKILKTISLRKN